MKRIPRRRHESTDHAEFGLLLPEPGSPVLSPERRARLERHVMDEVRRTAPAPAHNPPPPPVIPRPRLRRVTWIALPVAAALTAGAVLLDRPGTEQQPEPGPRAAASPPPEVRLEPGTTEGLSAAVDRISLAAARQPALEPRQDQFIYIESKVAFLRSEVTQGKEKNWVTPLHSRRIWQSPDGSKGFLYEPGHGFIDKKGEDLDDASSDKRHSYNSARSLPTDPDALLKKLYDQERKVNPQAAKGDPDTDWGVYKELQQLVHEQLATPKLSAAIYRATAKIPGVTLVADATDADGRPGVALALTHGGSRHEWIFDKRTYAYLGEREVLLKTAYGMKPGTVIGRTAVVERAVVDAKKELPGGKKL